MSCSLNETLDPRVRRTRKLLQDAFRELMHEKPYASVSVQDVTERATVNRATFYAHFPDKQALLASVLKAEFQTSMLGRFPEFPSFTHENLVLVVTAVYDFFAGKLSHCPKSAEHVKGVVDTAIQEELECLFRAWLEKDAPSAFAGHSVGTVASMLSWSVYGGAYRWSHGTQKRSSEAKARALVALLMPRVLVAG